MRSNERKRERNRNVKSRLKTLERRYLSAVTSGKKDEAAAAFQAVISAFDKAAKVGVIHCARADRKKSRLAARLNALK
jgi:small subunit ribosomal protein S20